MDRRMFLVMSGRSLALLALPGFLVTPDPSLPPADVERALKRARAAGKPLLVLVIPKEPKRAPFKVPLGTENGHDFALLLASGTDESFADLALCELVCASLDRLEVEVALPRRDREPLFVLVDGDDVVTPIDAPEPEEPEAPFDPEQSLDRRIAALAGAVHRALHSGANALEIRAARARAVLDAADVEAIEKHAADPARCPSALADSGAALLLERADSKGKRAAAVTKLARLARDRWRDDAPEGARWVMFEGDPCPPCGMAVMPTRSRRFLSFLVKE